ncbi:MAG: hypothetical protein ACYCX9_10760 [Candidatus Dormibacteria bacterium]
MTTDLWTAALRAEQLDQQLEATVTRGGFGNGRTEARVSIGPGLVNGMVALQQGLTSDWLFVSPDAALAVEVELAE